MVLGCGAICGVCAYAGCGVIAVVVLTVGTEGASKLARHGMVLAMPSNTDVSTIMSCLYYNV